jgi:hypothetical protein
MGVGVGVGKETGNQTGRGYDTIVEGNGGEMELL